MSNPAPNSGPDFESARRLMVASQLRPQGVTDLRVLGAMGAVPREDHLGAGQRALAYGDRPLRLDNGAPMMPPAVVGQLLTRLAPVPGERALVVGEGGAYSAALLRHIGLEVDTVSNGAGRGGEVYDLILVEGAIEFFPPTLAARLAESGRVGAAVVEDGVTRLASGHCIIDGAGGKTVGFTSFAEAQVPILPGFSSAPAFSF